ncbi:unnamed protein product [Rotaria sordida]|uniref:Uncharacterized protein n=1 Tax=Rotaria sordida TaxID=392033 RepID=A0A815GPW6_9BILA|nr:unnamed protein product [Rotaria sordida]CAF1597093.1 unnamed protein product [Rotaria sordida]
MPKKGRTNMNLTPNGWDHSERWRNLSKRELTNLISVMYYRAGITDQKEFVNGCINDPVICGLLVPCC